LLEIVGVQVARNEVSRYHTTSDYEYILNNCLAKAFEKVHLYEEVFMHIARYDLKEWLEKYLLDKIERYFKLADQGNENPTSDNEHASFTNPSAPKEAAFSIGNNDETSKKQAERYQYKIWQLKDRLSYGFFGPDSESLADDFIQQFKISVEKGSVEYYEILREVLNTEIEYYSFLLQQTGEVDGFLSDHYQKIIAALHKYER
jgi:hypothetical protein